MKKSTKNTADWSEFTEVLKNPGKLADFWTALDDPDLDVRQTQPLRQANMYHLANSTLFIYVRGRLKNGFAQVH